MEYDPVLALQQLLLQHLQSREMREALPVAEEVVITLERRGATGGALREPLHTLAALQVSQQLYAEAEESFNRAVGAGEEEGGGYAPSLIPILRHQARLYYALDRLDEAENALRRAQHITHRESGVHNLDQLEIIADISTIQVRTGRYAEADRQEHFYYEVSASNFGEEDARMLPAMGRLAHWLRQTGQYEDARVTYGAILARLRATPDRSPLEQVTPLREIAGISYLEGKCCADEPLREVVTILQDDPQTDEQDRIRAVLELADLHLMQRRDAEATELYQDAWRAMMRSEGDPARAANQFAEPKPLGVARSVDMAQAFREALSRQRRGAMESPYHKVIEYHQEGSDAGFSYRSDTKREPSRLVGSPLPLCYPHLMDLVRARDPVGLESLYMDIEFRVSETGHVDELDVVDSNAPPRLRRYVKHLLRKIRFRPRLTNGEPAARQVAWRQTFTSPDKADSTVEFPYGEAALKSGCHLITASR